MTTPEQVTLEHLFRLAVESANRADELGATFGPQAGTLMVGYAQLAQFYLNAIDVVHNYGRGVTG